MRDITLMPNDYIVTHIKTDTICEHFSNDDVVYAVDERIVPLVRCKECKYGSDNKVYGCSLINFNTDEWHRMYANDFCSRGERKERE